MIGFGRSARRLAAACCGLAVAAAAYAQEVPAQDNAWNFDDLEEADPGLLELLADQAPELALFAAFATLAMISFFRKSIPLKIATLVAAVGYLGFANSQLISITNVLAALHGSFPIYQDNLTFTLFVIFSIVTTILWGRVYCGRVCAFGALTQLIDAVVPSRFQWTVPPTLERRASYIKYVILAGAIVTFLMTSENGFYRYIEPFWMFSFRASTALWVGLGLLLIASIFVRNLYCRFLCPLGAALGLLSSVSVFRIKRWSECSTCSLCEKACEWGAIRERKIVMTECVRCDVCEILYDTKARCPHWLLDAKRKRRVKGTQGR